MTKILYQTIGTKKTKNRNPNSSKSLDELGFLLFKDYIFCRVLDIRVPQIVEAYLPQAVLLQQLGEVVGHGIGQDKVSHLIHEQVALEFLVVAVAAEFLVVLLLFLQRPQPLGKALYQWKGSQAGFGLGPVRLDKQVFALHAGGGHRVADGEGSCREVDGIPPQAQHLAPPQPVKGRELDDEFQPVPPRRLKQLLHLLGSVVSGHVPFRFGPLHLVHRIAGDEIQFHRLLQRLVEIGVQSQHTGGFQAFSARGDKSSGCVAPAGRPA